MIMKVLSFGSCNIDYVYRVDHLVRAGESLISKGREVFSGGKGLNQSIAAARGGAEVYFAGCIGNDGEFLADVLKESGVHLDYVKRVDEPNGHAIIQVDDNGENSIFTYKGTNEAITEEYIDEVLSHFDEGDILLMQNEISNVPYLVDKGYEKGLKIVFNPSPLNEELKKIDLSKVTYLILNEVEAKDISGKSEPDEFIGFVKKEYPMLKTVLTLGKNGCIYTDGEIRLTHPAFMVKAVDTVGAGDTFAGYFAALVSVGTECAEILKLASAASGIAVSRKGAAPSIPVIEEVKEGIKTMKVYGVKKLKNMNKEKIEDYIKTHLTDATLEGLADEIGYSRFYIGPWVRSVMNISFSQLLKKIRCEYAAKLLTETDMSVQEIIELTGYKNESFFRKIFKEQYGSAPFEFRKEKN